MVGYTITPYAEIDKCGKNNLSVFNKLLSSIIPSAVVSLQNFPLEALLERL